MAASNTQLEHEVVDQLEEVLQRVETLEFQLQQVFERNQRVENDKSWEIGLTRAICIALLTYIATASIFFLIGVEHFLLSAWVPTVAYFVSTLSLRLLRRKFAFGVHTKSNSPLRVFNS